MRYRVLLRKMPTRKWQVWVAAFDFKGSSEVVPIVNHAGRPSFDRARLKLKGAQKLPYNSLATMNFETKEDALTIAMQLGYALKLGPMMYAWLDEEEG